MKNPPVIPHSEPPGSDELSQGRPTRGMFLAILTDLHFWIPVVVLALGTGLLAILS
jgi:hypothetical protein